MFNNDFIANILLSLAVREFRKSVSIWQSYGQKSSVLFFGSYMYEKVLSMNAKSLLQADFDHDCVATDGEHSEHSVSIASKGKKRHIAVCATSTKPLTEACMSYWITQSYLSPCRGSTPTLNQAMTGRYSIYLPIKNERQSRLEPTQVNDLPRVATKVLAIPDSWLSRPSAPLDTVGVNNLPTAAPQ